jgi:hypothetical protein
VTVVIVNEVAKAKNFYDRTTPSVCLRWLFSYWYFQGIARTQSPTNINYAPESPTFGVIGFVQWSDLAKECREEEREQEHMDLGWRHPG